MVRTRRDAPGSGSRAISWVGVKTASALLGVSPSTLRRWDKAGVLPAERHPSNHHRVYDEARLRAFMEARTRRESAPRVLTLGRAFRDGRIVGRAGVLACLDAKVEAGERLIVIIGPPGVGKSRVARAWMKGREPTPRFAAVGACRSVEELALVVASALEAPSRAVTDGALADDLVREARVHAGEILVLDELENLDEPGLRLVGRLSTTGLVLVATSRIRPRLVGEDVVRLPPLDYPDTDEPAKARESPAVAFFLERAQRNGLTIIDDEVLGHAAAIVRRLEGLPLALELAASRTASVGIARLRRELDASIEAVGAAPIDASAQHRTLRAAVSSSIERLDARSRAVLESAALLPQGFALEELENFIGEEETRGDGVLECARTLTDHSMISAQQDGASSASLSFAIHAVVRDVVLEAVPTDRREALEARHAAWRAREARQLAADRSAPAAMRIARIEGGLRRAWAWTQEHLASAGAVSMAVDLACAVGRRVETYGPSPAFMDILDRSDALAREAGIDRARRAELAFYRALARLERSLFDEARALLDETRALASEGESPRFEAIAWTLIGWLEARAGRTDEAERSFVLAERATAPRGDPWPEMVIASIRAQLELRRGRLTSARRGLEHARALAVRVGDGTNEASACGFLGSVAYDEGALREAVRHYDRAMTIATAAQASLPVAIFSGYRAIALHDVGDLGAREAYDDALARTRRAHSPRFEGLFTGWRGVLVGQTGLLDEAADAMSRAESLADGWQQAAIVSLHRGHLNLAEARRAEDPADAQRHLALAARRLADVPRVEGLDVTRELRIAHRFLERALCAHDVRGPAAQLTVGWQGQWIEAGATRIELRTHRAQRRLVWELALRRLLEPGVPAEADALIATAWPEERLLPDAATHRLRVALSTLRRRGLGAVIQTTGEGYRLDPRQSLALAADERAAPRAI